MTKVSLGEQLLQRWRLLQRLPGGVWLFNRALARKVPYSGSIAARIVTLEPGYVRAELPDRHRIRNHLNSIHAIALVNLGELVSGLAVLTALPAGVRGIVTGLQIDYLKKARGTLVAESRCRLPEPLTALHDDMEYQVVADIWDADNDTVARATVCWRLGPG